MVLKVLMVKLNKGAYWLKMVNYQQNIIIFGMAFALVLNKYFIGNLSIIKNYWKRKWLNTIKQFKRKKILKVALILLV